MEDLLKNFFEKKFYTVAGLGAGIILIFLALIPIDSFLEKGITTFLTRCIIYASIVVIWTIIWWRLSTYLPTNPKDKIGISF